ncbi:LytTR family DNA-binding domain-containing protein [Clostridium sp. LQ25]|uniref:LytR/AlgR family response regulator transcription factor n=1 Tax=Clostridium sp. LQ25 TaxID=2992805 RepID=UPI00224F839B|nr:LytTR family DNA-binding domain-containing protein [Clostridium sp. LQ25]UZT06168.1 LytTR family DNA-binding domain-containing protein [Clostridium sp. LQ25]
MESYIKIAICDDERTILNDITINIERFIKGNSYKGDIDSFLDGCELLNKIENNEQYYDIYILDVEMDTINGVEIAKRIRKAQKDALIVFLTGYDTWMPQAFDVQVFNYILKSNKSDKLEEVLVKALESIKAKRTLFYFKQGKNLISIPYKKIYYFESEKRKAKIILNDVEYSYYDKLDTIENNVREDIFIRVHTSFLVNMEHIHKFDGKSIILDNNLTVPVSQKYAYSFNMSFIEFIKRRC